MLNKLATLYLFCESGKAEACFIKKDYHVRLPGGVLILYYL